ncbi:MAG: Mov34/MPN/PAD-1 family protein [Pseudonocardiaceae bacterium]
MTSDLFEPTNAATRPPIPGGARDLRVTDAASFGPDDDFMLYVTAEAIGQLRAATVRAEPNEAFGLLLGRTFQDGRGIYTLVANVMEAAERDAGPGHVRLSIKQISGLRQRAQRAYPTHDLVGWWHSHDRYPDYSHTDREEQATWTDPNHVGLLTMMHGDVFGRAYRGPTSRLLPAHSPNPVATLARVKPAELRPGTQSRRSLLGKPRNAQVS